MLCYVTNEHPCPPSLRLRARLERLASKHWQTLAVVIISAAMIVLGYH